MNGGIRAAVLIEKLLSVELHTPRCRGGKMKVHFG